MYRGIGYGVGLLLRRRRCGATLLNLKFGALSFLLRHSICASAGDVTSKCCIRWERGFCSYAVEQFSDDEYECEFDNQQRSSSMANIDEWRWKLGLLLRNPEEQEIVSRDKRDRRDYEQISNLAKILGLYSELYGKVVVASKVPLPNYRPDLDDKRPQREVVIPLSLQRRVEGLLQDHVDKILLTSNKVSGELENNSSSKVVEDDEPYERQESLVDGSVMEKILQRKSNRMRNMQITWQESPEGVKMLNFRKSLPSFKEKDRLLAAIAHNQVMVISGETGCGKTTQLPQYVLESEIESGRGAFCNIICTQPRRISAMAVAERVSTERGENLGETVGYKVRLEGIKGKNTHLLFCTSGILLRRLLGDRNLNGVTHVFVDEIHERGMNEDFLLIVLKDLLRRRRDLRLILMSATLNAELFSSYFGGAPTIHIPGFTYPVRAHFLEDILEKTGYKLTSFNQIDDYGQEKLWKMQRQLMPRKRKNQITSLVEDALKNSNFEDYSSRARDSLASWTPDCIGFNLIEAVLCYICRKEQPGAVLVFMTGWDDISCLRDQLRAHPLLGDPNRVLVIACHGSMATSEQKLIFEKPPPNVRKVVLATNMAEASITINDIVFVVDCGKAKETTYDALNNTPCLLPSWISKASAHQRRGRAGRVQPGECYHLYPRCVYDAFAEYQLPELLRTPLNSLCLQIKSLQVGSIGEFLSASLQPPESLSLAGTAKSRFSGKDYSDHMALVRAYEGWKDAEREGSTYEYCWRNFLSTQTLQAIHSLRKQFSFILKDAGLVDTDSSISNSLSHNQSLVRAIICSGLFPGIASVVHREKSMSFKTMDDGQVLLYANSVNAKYQTIPYPWLVFGEKVKVNTVFIRDSTGVSDSILILFGGSLVRGEMSGHLKMLDGYIDFFMDPNLINCYWNLKTELDKLVLRKLEDPKIDIHKEGKFLMLAVQELVSGDLCEGRFVFGRETRRVRSSSNESNKHDLLTNVTNPKGLLQTLLMRAGHTPPRYKMKHLKTNEFRAIVEFKGMQFIGKPKKCKQFAERDAAIEGLTWLTHTEKRHQHVGDEDSEIDLTDNMLKLLSKPRRKKSKHQR
ncbi:DExH-box ATP-dependent RNA helicase DExH3-like isoform X2 [Zingiber officinale]|uniref:DExH-box ATP-dependent RNA helicase DExH3-like isoform X2 n=1 Tax=Zingiber officinale TaxID=94328 RepID=UPI001C4B9B4A|nr:DExH-box ATP-dependent RNA helicase DExH3-like isoform X2 [Zingiber officinale]